LPGYTNTRPHTATTTEHFTQTKKRAPKKHQNTQKQNKTKTPQQERDNERSALQPVGRASIIIRCWIFPAIHSARLPRRHLRTGLRWKMQALRHEFSFLFVFLEHNIPLHPILELEMAVWMTAWNERTINGGAGLLNGVLDACLGDTILYCELP
jgi:hypothetical protein